MIPVDLARAPRRLRLPPGGARLRRRLTPLAARCFALVAGLYLSVLSPLLALASFASDARGTRA